MRYLFCFLAVASFGILTMCGCVRTNDEANHLDSLYIRVAALQNELYSQLPELGKVALQMDTIAKRQDWAIRGMDTAIKTAIQMIARTFTTIDSLITPLPQNDLEVLIKDAEMKERVLKSAIDQVSQAIKKSHEVIDVVKIADARTKASER
jgi:hypothetical protein